MPPIGEFEALLRTPWSGPWRQFARPVAVLTARDAADVRDCLAEIEHQTTSHGYFAAGFVCYEAAAAFGLPVHAAGGSLPLVCFGLFEPEGVTSLSQLPAAAPHRLEDWHPTINGSGYEVSIDRIKRFIEAGDTYQINYTFRLYASFAGEPLSLYASLVQAQAGSWAAYVDLGTHAICSASPELFFTLENGRLECRPMKGTARRGLSTEADRLQASRLQSSDKDRAENVMVVDVVRNDLGRIAKIGSVQVPSLYSVERFPAQWQLTSTVVADLAQDGSSVLSSVFEAMFPSPSVTGAPKHRSMDIIRELERAPRGIYTGAIGYLTPDRRAHFNVAIRTVTVDRVQGSAEFGVGSAIVWDSTPTAEYAECLLKASILVPDARLQRQMDFGFQLLETMLWTPDRGVYLLDRHLARLQESAEYFGFAIDREAIQTELDAALNGLTGPAKIRLLVARDGDTVIQVLDVEDSPEPLTAALAAEPVDDTDVFLYHKTTRRAVYERARASRPDADVVLLWNAAGEVTEATIFNLVVEIGGRKVTPPIAGGLLAGTLRGELLESGEIEEQRISVAQLREATALWGINSVAGWRRLTLMD